MVVQFPGRTVERHAHSVELVGEAMELARSAVRDVVMDGGAYGELCQFLPAVLSPLFDTGADALSTAVDVLHETAIALRTTAASMSATDQAGATRLESAR
jgi:hypothetical protein